GMEGYIYHGLKTLAGELLGREWPRDGGGVLRIERCGIDANWGASTDLVYQFCRESDHAAVLLPTHGKAFGASNLPMSEYKKKPGDRVGFHWLMPNVVGKRAIRHVIIDTHFWKTFAHARLATAMGDKGCLSLFGKTGTDHRLLSEHLANSEFRVRTQG